MSESMLSNTAKKLKVVEIGDNVLLDASARQPAEHATVAATQIYCVVTI